MKPQIIHLDTFEKTATVVLDKGGVVNLEISIDEVDDCICDVYAVNPKKEEKVQDAFQEIVDALQKEYADHISSQGRACHLRF